LFFWQRDETFFWIFRAVFWSRSWFEFCLKSFRLYRKHKFFCRQNFCFDDKINICMRNNVSWFFVAN
jgi:hypothetical protein